MADPINNPDDTGPVAAVTDALAADTEANRKEEADVTSWTKKLQEARDFDAAARAQYAKDRGYARGDSKSWEVAVNLLGANVDTLAAELYAKDPDVDATLAERVDGPRELAPVQPPPPLNPADPHQVAAYATEQAKYQQSLIAYHGVQQERRKQADDRKAYSRTMSICISRSWKDAKVKRQAKRQVRSALTIGVGWTKTTWQERHGERDPATQQTVNDSQARLDRYNALRAQADANGQGVVPEDAKLAELERAHAALLAEHPEKPVIARGLADDFVRGDDMQVSPECPSLLDYVDAPWISHRTYMTKTAALMMCPQLADKVEGQRLIDSAATYGQKKPVDLMAQEIGEVVDGEKARDASSADAFEVQQIKGDGAFVCFEEIWHKDGGEILSIIHGVKRWARKPMTPEPMTTRFYPFFAYAPIEVEGERHPQSKIYRSYKLQDEYNRSRSAKTRLRRRAVPGVIFNRQQMTPEDAAKVANSDVAENIGIDPIDPATPLSAMFTPKPVPAVDQALYDTSEIRADMESIWGLQDALTGRVQVAKTAHEAEIQNQGTETRSGADRDALEDMLTEKARYTAEVLRAKLTLADAQNYAGDFAFWPEGKDANDAAWMLDINIRAGSSGKPDTSREQQAWAALLPVLQAAVPQIAQLRKADPSDIADALEALVEKSMEVAGSTDDIERYVPQGNATQQQPAPTPMQPTMPPGGPGPMPGLPPGLPGPGASPMPDAPPANAMPQEAMNVGP